MTDLIGELRARRLVRELDPVRRPGAGRPTRPIAFDGEPWCVLGIHVNLDKVSFAASTVGGRELWSEIVPADLRHTGPEGYAHLDKLLRDQLRRIPADQQLVALEIGLGGFIAADRTTVLDYDKFDWRDFDLGAAVTATLHELGIDHASVSVSNECQLAALYSTRVELPLPGDAIAVYLGGTRTMGSGAIIRGEIFRGAGGGAGRFAHVNIDASGPECWCGRSGCLESLVGPAALLANAQLVPAEQAREVVDRDPEAALAMIVEAAQAGEKRVLETLEKAGDVLGRAVDDLLGAVNPHAVVLGGYLGLLSDYVMPTLRERLAIRLAAPAYAGTEIMALRELGPRSVQGALLSARDACLYDPLALTRPIL
jgi:predicted NBD/HSP70 family sugar kinase